MMLHYGLGGLRCREHLQCVEIVLLHGCHRDVGVRPGIAFDSSKNPQVAPVQYRQACVLGYYLPCITGIERQRVLPRHPRAAVAAVLPAEKAAFQRMNPFELWDCREGEQLQHHVARIVTPGFRPPDEALYVLQRVVDVPRLAINPDELLVGHRLMSRGHVHDVIPVQVGLHWYARQMQLLVVRGAGQRRQDEELKQVDRQLFLDYADVALYRCGRVAGEAEDVTGVGQRADAVPRLQHRAVLRDAVLAFPRILQRLRVDVLHTDEHAVHSRARGLLDEASDLVRSGVDLG